MKKILVVLLILGFVAGGVFAADLGEGLSISGEISSGINAESSDGDTYVSLWHDDGGNARALLTFEWATDAGGFKTQLKGIAGYDGNASSVTVPWAWGWVNLFNNKATLVAGKIDSNVWGLGNLSTNAFDPNLDAVGGARLEIKPIDGLNLGVALPLPDGPGVVDISKYFNIVFGALYKAPAFDIAVAAKIIKMDEIGVTVNYGIDRDPDSTTYGTIVDLNASNSATAAYSGVELIAGVGVPLTDLGLKIGVDFQMKSGDIGYIKVGPKVDFTKDALGVNGKVIFEANNEKNAKLFKDDGWKIKEAGDSALAFELGVEYKVTPIITGKLYLGSDNLTYLDGNGLWVKPQGTFALSPNAEINVFDKISKIGGDEKVAGKIKNQLQVNFTWKF
ncbi:hypothetical protein FACS1894163_06610 [Spirochaetia bacterium]|nr:hypothetical protein FACS1894163_06610 [Spirochaetia bacterium]